MSKATASVLERMGKKKKSHDCVLDVSQEKTKKKKRPKKSSESRDSSGEKKYTKKAKQ
jgi:hypothetical protein